MDRGGTDPGLEAAARYVREKLGQPLDDASARDPWTVGWALLQEVAKNGDPFEGEAPEHFIHAVAGEVEEMAREVIREGKFLLDHSSLVAEAISTALLLASNKRHRSLLEPWMFAVTCDAAHRIRHDPAAAAGAPDAPPRARARLQAIAHQMNVLEYPERAIVWRVLVDGRPAEQVAREEGLVLEEVEQLVASVLMRADREVEEQKRRRPGRGSSQEAKPESEDEDEEEDEGPGAQEADHG